MNDILLCLRLGQYLYKQEEKYTLIRNIWDNLIEGMVIYILSEMNMI